MRRQRWAFGAMAMLLVVVAALVGAEEARVVGVDAGEHVVLWGHSHRHAAWAEYLTANSAGRVAFAAPLYVAQGDSDQLVRPSDTARFVAHEKSLGMNVTEERIPLADHGTIAYLALPGMLHWLDARAGG